MINEPPLPFLSHRIHPSLSLLDKTCPSCADLFRVSSSAKITGVFGGPGMCGCLVQLLGYPSAFIRISRALRGWIPVASACVWVKFSRFAAVSAHFWTYLAMKTKENVCLAGFRRMLLAKWHILNIVSLYFYMVYTMIVMTMIPNWAASNKPPLNSQLFVDFDATAFKVCTHQAQLRAKSTPKRGWFWIQIRRPPARLPSKTVFLV